MPNILNLISLYIKQLIKHRFVASVDMLFHNCMVHPFQNLVNHTISRTKIWAYLNGRDSSDPMRKVYPYLFQTKVYKQNISKLG